MPFNSVLRSLRKENSLTQRELGLALGLSESTIGMYERGQREPDFETLEAIADYFNVDMDFLTGRSATKREYTFSPEGYPANSHSYPKNIQPMPKMKMVPLLGTIACGEPILAAENVEMDVAMPEHVVADFALRCKGDSMINARIYDGDIVYIRQQAQVENGQIAAVLIGDEATLKKVNYTPEKNTLVLSPANSEYEPFVFVGEELNNVRILGKAVAFTSNVR